MDINALIHGIQDASTDKKLALSESEMLQARRSFLQKIQKFLVEQKKTLATSNLKAGNEFLKGNASKPGVITTKSGLQYKVINEGSGPMPKMDDTVTTHYEGRLIDGSVFDSSYKRFVFALLFAPIIIIIS